MKRQNIILGLLCAVVLFIMSGCGKKNSITASEFKNMSENIGYTVYDVTNQYSQYDYFDSATIAKSSSEYQVEFYVLTDDSSANGMFNTNKTKFENYKEGSSLSSSASVSNYSTYSLTSGGYYMYLSRIDNTLLYLRVEDEYKNQVKNFVDKLGY